MFDWLEKAREDIAYRIYQSIEKGEKEGRFSFDEIPSFLVMKPKIAGNGDFATNAPMVLASAGKLPVDRAGDYMMVHLSLEDLSIDHYSFKAPGFMNFFMKEDWYYHGLLSMYQEGQKVEIFSERAALSENHPLFYAQYTCSRIQNILQQMERRGIEIPDLAKINFKFTEEDMGWPLLRRIMDFPREERWIGTQYEFRFYRFIHDMVKNFQRFYNGGFLREREETVLVQRMILLSTLEKVLSFSLNRLGVGIIKNEYPKERSR